MNRAIRNANDLTSDHLDPISTLSVNEVFEASLHCKYKAYLMLKGYRGTKCEYESMCDDVRANARRIAVERFQASGGIADTPTHPILTDSLLRQAEPFIYDVDLPIGPYLLHFDGLKRIDGTSDLGNFHYIPVLFHARSKHGKEQKVLLELASLYLSDLQGETSNKGLLLSGNDGRLATLRLSSDRSTVRREMKDLEQLRTTSEPPPLILNAHCHVCEFHHQCQQQAMEQGNLSLLGIGKKEINAYARKGILTLTQLAHTFRPRRKGKRVERSKRRYHALQAMALRDKTVFVLGTPSLPKSQVQVYLDLEGDPDEGYIYLIGMVVRDGVSEHSYSFWANNQNQESEILQQFLQTLGLYENFQVYCYGSYEKTFLKKMRSNLKLRRHLDQVLKVLTNVLSVVYSHIYFPCYTNGLKDVASYIGFSWTEAEASGLQSIVWRKRWQTAHDETWKQKLVTYNLEDCYALKQVAEFLSALAEKATGSVQRPTGDAQAVQPPVMWVQDIDNRAYTRKWGPVNFFHPEYEYINKCAYFDYQRKRVFVRTSKTIRRQIRKTGQTAFHNRKLRVSKHIRIESKKCPVCKSSDLIVLERKSVVLPGKPRVKRAFDLVLTSSGIKRKVFECRAVVQQCQKCSEIFVPWKYERLDKHFHGLKSWAMFQHIAYGTSFGVLEEMFREFFDLCIHNTEIHMFKSLMAHYYKPTYRSLLKKILAGPVMHIDDTDVKLRTGRGYVCVVTSLEEVVFIYRPTKEGEFVRDLLKDFHGVLVSDFHPTYDSMLCPQQKCLIHLMRDMNQDLLNNPFDQELQLITGPFGSLLRSVVEAVDQHGLKRCHLKRHDRDVAKFFDFVSTLSVKSDAARRLQERFVRCRDKLFTFIKYDGVPWNNNNAENAIKRFAYYREGTAGTMREEGLSNYLMLLSIYQTCRYKGVSFLRFLLSRERDLDAFCAGEHRKRRRPLIETYPKDFTSHLLRQSERRRASQEGGGGRDRRIEGRGGDSKAGLIG